VFFQNLLIICTTNGLLWLKASIRISHDSFFSHALFGISGFTEMMLFLITLRLTFKSVFSMVRQSIALWLRLDSNSLELNIENV